MAGDREPGNGQPSYHDLYVTTAGIPRARLFDLPYGLEVTCNRVAGWQLVRMADSRSLNRGTVIAGEYDGPDAWLVLDVAGQVIVDSRRESRPFEAADEEE
jgi:hypothetical protein